MTKQSQSDVDRNGNENCLQGLECPQCGNHKKLRICCQTFVEMTDMGSGEHEDLEYDSESWCMCPNCGHGETLGGFQIDDE